MCIGLQIRNQSYKFLVNVRFGPYIIYGKVDEATLKQLLTLTISNGNRGDAVSRVGGLEQQLGIDDYIGRAHARSTTIENGYLPCAHVWSSQWGIAIVRAQI